MAAHREAEARERARDHLRFLYGPRAGEEAYGRLRGILERAARGLARRPEPGSALGPYRLPLDQRDAILITYGDQFRLRGEKPLQTLQRFMAGHLEGTLSGVHLLPFFPYSSDDGFSVMDFRRVDPRLGSWREVQALAGPFRLMVDLVLNHVSRSSRAFQGFLREEERYRDCFITVAEGTDLSAVVRPRALPLLTRVQRRSGEALVWTTFSEDQIDLNYANPAVALEMIEVLLGYVRKGAQLIRLDAVAYLWKEIGTTCIHLEQTHRMVKLFRAVLDVVAPWVMIITETNVPHRDNVSYFGTGTDEAQLVYQFSLPPLVLDAFHRGDAARLRGWARSLGQLSGNITFFNFLASHDGVGVLPAQDILSASELSGLLRLVEERGGLVSTRSTPQGEIPYELNISYFDAVSGGDTPPGLAVRKFLTSQAVMLAFRGVPGIYVHSLLGTRNDREGVERTGVRRVINRRKLDLQELERELARPGSLPAEVLAGYTAMLRARSREAAFHPASGQRLPAVGPARRGQAGWPEGAEPVLALLRTAPGGSEQVLCLFNTAGADVECRVETGQPGGAVRDLLSPAGRPPVCREGALEVHLPAWGCRWLRFSDGEVSPRR